MDKKYNDYDPGIYDTSKIFLQASDVDGSLEKVNLPAPTPFAMLALFIFDITADPINFYTAYSDAGEIDSIVKFLPGQYGILTVDGLPLPATTPFFLINSPVPNDLTPWCDSSDDGVIYFGWRDSSGAFADPPSSEWYLQFFWYPGF